MIYWAIFVVFSLLASNMLSGSVRCVTRVFMGVLVVRVLVFFLIKVVLLASLPQVAVSDSGYAVIAGSIGEPVFLTLCGVALLTFGVLGRRQSAKR